MLYSDYSLLRLGVEVRIATTTRHKNVQKFLGFGPEALEAATVD